VPNLDAIDLIVRDVPAAAALFRDVVRLKVREIGDRFAELDAGTFTLMLSPDAMVPTRQAAGVVFHLRVDDVPAALEAARARGARVLMDVTRTDWGTESAMIAGPEEIVVDFHRPARGA
jgi:predicted enzyme related to lactoylglutathione lyase